MKAWDEKVGDFVDLNALEAEQTKPKPQPKYRNAFYKPVEGGFLTAEQKVQQEQPHNEPVSEKNAPVAAYEYNIEIACTQEELITYQIGVFSLGKTSNEPLIDSWKKSASQAGFTLLTASVMVNEPKMLYREFFTSSGNAFSFESVQPVKKGAGTHSESFVPIKAAVQVGEQLGWPTAGFYYHFVDDKLLHEYQIVGDEASTFVATQSNAEQLSSERLSDHQYNFILLPWKINNSPVTRQHLLYLPQKMPQQEFNDLNANWLDENANLLDVESIVKSKNESALAREKTEGDEVTYVIQSGDSLSKIAHQQGTTVESLVELNPQYKGKEGQIEVDDILIIESNKDESTNTPAHIVVLNGDGNREAWDEIAKQHGMAPKDLLKLNPMFENNPTALKVGDELCVNAPQQAKDKAQRTTLPPIVLTHIGQVSSFVNSFSSMSERLLNAFVVAALSDKNIPANTPIVNVGKKTLRSTELSASNDLELLANEKGEVIKKKAESESVKAIQKALLKLNFDLGSAGADGKFGAGTESVIKTFQSTYTPTNKIHADYKIGSADGIVGKNTLLALDEAVVGLWIYERGEFKFTLSIMQDIYPSVKDSKKEELKAIADELNSHLEFYKLDTPLRRAHFFAQIMQETGASLSIEELFRYSYNGLIGTFKNFRRNKELAKKLSYDNEIKGKNTKRNGDLLSLDDFKAVANVAYGGRMGNIDNNDGWKYRGRGLKQLTGKDNYKAFDTWHNDNSKQWSEDVGLSFLDRPDLLLNMKYATRSAAFFWVSNKLYQLADNGPDISVSKSITDIVNYYTDSKQLRFDNFNKLYSNGVFE
ncbi:MULTISPECIES: LysM peptidoglycan-binding domain-containing protein [Aliivibrio]|uniref:LysM peptidoglycan-binding domain-containing protein n=1 Tax=Aliivibrio finisterrensis TaxID=511998 RepID=A0A4Q5KVI8_9GAMM|nr:MULTISPECIES: LysM peptidoglycan-binding domain-containing protein [Aliivibrio]MDD9178658.1 LysM peptidoglycan-binding domain-containing protein [Aliivibrio sp. A6]RYU52504.1 LysM peptidoglycan-binding domain-containing protein [Aliivibrio finisterrensis]RYU55100.1 LysM peptidoglycan-binding domain-containing protein [Aliivibrio finisterrensis]RYU59759.1 LysM peptidoglycan-binding domain-containing protein [Aliivibrio finisterrensis]RYU65624.1 LysM peptidoglycan-binding domain-containing pr